MLVQNELNSSCLNSRVNIVFNPLVQPIHTKPVLAALRPVQQHRAAKFTESPFLCNNFSNDVSESGQSTVRMLFSIPVPPMLNTVTVHSVQTAGLDKI